MSLLKSIRSSTLFRCLVVPTLFLCAIFHRHPVFQWIAVIALAIWLLSMLRDPICNLAMKMHRKKEEQQLALLSSKAPLESDAAPQRTADSDLFLIRQINFRITEQLKSTYPAVSWRWVERPPVEDLCKGGSWRIRVSNAEPFNFSEVALTKSGKLSIIMLQATPLKEAKVLEEDDSDLSEDELMERVDVKSWYSSEGEKILTRMIDDLNTQGYHNLLIHEGGDVCITTSDTEEKIEQIQNFPPRTIWEEFCHVLREDEITASIQPEGLSLSW